MKKFIIFILATVSLPACADEQQPALSNQQMMMKGCLKKMTDEMKQFYTQLNPSNQLLFCKKFDNNLRKEAMKLTDEMNGAVNADGCVELVAANHHLTD